MTCYPNMDHSRRDWPVSAIAAPARLSALYNLIRGASIAVDNNDRITAKAVLTNAEKMVLAMMENGK